MKSVFRAVRFGGGRGGGYHYPAVGKTAFTRNVSKNKFQRVFQNLKNGLWQ